MAIFSKEMEIELIGLIDKRLEIMRILPTIESYKNMCLKTEKNVKDINDRLVNVEDNTETFENDIHELNQEVKESIKGEDLKDLVGQTMLALMPNFKLSISKEIKTHLVAISEYVIKTFK
jgi:predicted transcriptional regulator